MVCKNTFYTNKVRTLVRIGSKGKGSSSKQSEKFQSRALKGGERHESSKSLKGSEGYASTPLRQ
jgi:hypothetical protein